MVNRSGTTVRNVRYRWPLSSEAITDQFDEIYNDLVGLVGYQNVSGVIAVSGEFMDIMNIMEGERYALWGYSASGISEAYVHNSGFVDAQLTNVDELMAYTDSLIANPI